MTRELIERSRRRRGIADVSLIVTAIALVASLVVAATAVSIGIARADTLGQVAADGGVRWAFAVVLVLIAAGLGGVTAAMAPGRRSRRRG